MKVKTTSSQNDNCKKTSKELLNKKIIEKLSTRGICDPGKATADQLYHAVVYVMKDMILILVNG